MKGKNKFLYLLLSLFLITACNDKEVEETTEVVRTTDLIENIREYEQEQQAQKDLEELAKAKKNKDKKAKEDADQKQAATEEVNKEESADDTADEEKKDQQAKEKTGPAKTETVTIKAFGDIMAHDVQLGYAYNRGAGDYDFSDSFAKIADFAADADITIGNYETTTNPNVPYAGFPQFNTPAAYIDAIKDAGFDILTTANNHSMDTEVEGVYSTMEAIEERGLDFVGSMRDESEKILMKEVNGINIAFLSYTYGCNGRENLLVPREEVAELNYLNDEQIEKDIKKAKGMGADFIVVYPHWGIEYQSYPDQRQIDLGREMIEWGADLVIGNHPHVVQPGEWYEATNGRTGFIAYACGNVISYQNLETLGDIRTEQSVAYEITLEKNLTDGSTTVKAVDAHPLWVGLTYNDYGANIQTYLTTDYLEGGSLYSNVEDYQRNRIDQAYNMTVDTVNTEVQ